LRAVSVLEGPEDAGDEDDMTMKDSAGFTTRFGEDGSAAVLGLDGRFDPTGISSPVSSPVGSLVSGLGYFCPTVLLEVGESGCDFLPCEVEVPPGLILPLLLRRAFEVAPDRSKYASSLGDPAFSTAIVSRAVVGGRGLVLGLGGAHARSGIRRGGLAVFAL
jgi:hypothetical protein